MSDLIDRQAAINSLHMHLMYRMGTDSNKKRLDDWINNLPSAQPERLTDDDFETIRIHLNAYKEKLCNQQRWEEAEEYQRIIDRFMAFASAQPDLQPTCNQLVSEPYRSIEYFMHLPSAQPYTDEEIQKMQDLEQAQIDKAFELGREEGRKEAHPEQRWIPCSIKRPQKGLMLVAFNDGDIDLLKQPTAYRRSDIVAWMPVEPYREEGEQDEEAQN